MKLIPLDAVLAEIERLENQNYKNSNDFNLGAATYLGILKHFINTLEVKEVDIEKEVIDWWNTHYSSKAYTFEGYTGHYVENSTLIEIAKHFFELGVNVSNPLTWEDIKIILDIENDILRECNSHKDLVIKTYPKGEDYYGEILKRFKAQKGE